MVKYFKSNITKLIMLQKKVIRIINKQIIDKSEDKHILVILKKKIIF